MALPSCRGSAAWAGASKAQAARRPGHLARGAGGDALESGLFALSSKASDAVLAGLSADGSPLLFPLLFLGGLASSLNPCAAASLPAAAAAVTALSRNESPVPQAIAYAAGSATVLTALGLAVSLAGERLPLGEGVLLWLFPVVAVVMGLSLLEVIPLKVSGLSGLDDLSSAAPREVQGFMLGAASAAGASPCATPVLVTITSYVASNSVGAVSSAALLLSYAMGYSAPLALVSVSAGLLPWFQESGRWGKVVSGAAILVVGVLQFMSAVRSTFGSSEGEAVEAIVLLCAVIALLLKAASGVPLLQVGSSRGTEVEVVAVPGQAGLYEYRPLSAAVQSSEQAASGGSLQLTGEEGLDVDSLDRRSLAAISVLGGTALAGAGQAVPYLGGETRDDAADIIRRSAASSRPLGRALRSGRPVLVDFSATWCVECLKSAPVLRDLERQYGSSIEFVTKDVTSWQPDTGDAETDWWIRQFRVDGLPHIAFLTPDRRVITALIGNLPPEVLQENVEALAKLKQAPGPADKLPELPYTMFDAFDGGRRRLELRP
eukprot:TRINITY_DN61704_c0_g1_i1.p1 TRINITY_DN61704_c0_g1~~TRINITY_DN61704_c0_g1_i1.p1  ORF type:complete len:578 (+),score=108.64 TRINITY_DN61704_c0_g1_i1:95-1735(+)